MLLKLKDKEYTLRLSLKELWGLEQREQRSLTKLFNEDEGALVIDSAVKIFHAALLSHHPDMTLEDALDLYEELVEHEGMTFTKFQELLEELFEKSGLIQGED